MIRVKCPNSKCQQTLTVKDEFAGRTGKCPACGTAVQVPAAKPQAAEAPAAPQKALPKSPPAVNPRLSLDDLPDDAGLVDDEKTPAAPPSAKVNKQEKVVEDEDEVVD